MDETKKTVEQNEIEALAVKYRDLIDRILAEPRVNPAGKNFAKGCAKFLDLQGYLSAKQRVTLEVIYENSIGG